MILWRKYFSSGNENRNTYVNPKWKEKKKKKKGKIEIE